MPTTDPKTTIQTSQTSGTASQPSSQNDEFDLGITQELPAGEPTSPIAENSEPLETASQGENQTFDFSLDLPETYTETAEQQPDSTVQTTPEFEAIHAPVNEAETEEEKVLFQTSNDDSLPQENGEVVAMDTTATEDRALSNDASLLAEEPLPTKSEASTIEDTIPGETIQLEETETSEALNLQEGTTNSEVQSDSKVINSEPLQEEAEIQNIEGTNAPEAQETSIQNESLTFQAPQNISEEAKVEESKKALNLDEMISHFSTNENPNIAQSEMDPFSAMKATLEAQKEETNTSPSTSEQLMPKEAVSSEANSLIDQSTENSQAQAIQNQAPQLEAPSSLLPQNQEIQSPQTVVEAKDQPSSAMSQTLNLDTLTSMPIASVPTNPLTAPVAYPQQIATQAPSNKKGIFVALASFVAVIALGVMAYIRYPDVFNFSFLTGTGSTTGVIAQNPSEIEHGAAPEMPLTGKDTQLTGENLSEEDMQIQPVEAEEITGDFSDEGSGTIQTIDLTQGEEDHSLEPGNEIALQNENPDNAPDTSKDSLGAVEELVGPINNADTLKQEIVDYQQKGIEFKEKGAAQNKRVMMKYGLAVEKETQKVLDDLANGGNIDISTWSSLKTKLDDYLVKATNA